MHLIILLLVFIDVLAVFGESLLYSVCDPKPSAEARVHTWTEALGWVSKSALILMLLQQVTLIFCLGHRYFLKCFYVLDLLVLSIALIMELILHEAGGGWLALLLCWRFVRLLHGFAVQVEMSTSSEELQEEIMRLKSQVQFLQEQLQKTQIDGLDEPVDLLDYESKKSPKSEVYFLHIRPVHSMKSLSPTILPPTGRIDQSNEAGATEATAENK